MNKIPIPIPYKDKSLTIEQYIQAPTPPLQDGDYFVEVEFGYFARYNLKKMNIQPILEDYVGTRTNG